MPEAGGDRGPDDQEDQKDRDERAEHLRKQIEALRAGESTGPRTPRDFTAPLPPEQDAEEGDAEGESP
ncbi:MAG: hypothetical protein ACXV8R_03235 [Acidimicrobiia bacterium]